MARLVRRERQEELLVEEETLVGVGTVVEAVLEHAMVDGDAFDAVAAEAVAVDVDVATAVDVVLLALWMLPSSNRLSCRR